jgi:hypothetical protein
MAAPINPRIANAPIVSSGVRGNVIESSILPFPV